MTNKGNHNEKMQELIRGYVGQYMSRESGTGSLITVTGVVMSPDGKNATILFTTIPESKQNAALGFFKRHLGEMREYIKKNIATHTIPYLDVKIDLGEKSSGCLD